MRQFTSYLPFPLSTSLLAAYPDAMNLPAPWAKEEAILDELLSRRWATALLPAGVGEGELSLTLRRKLLLEGGDDEVNNNQSIS